MTGEGLAEVKLAAQVFVDAIHKNYVTWSCEQTTKVEIEVLPWIKEYHPDWLEEGK
jgi:hypothetical protein